jgi:hypothetical protein
MSQYQKIVQLEIENSKMIINAINKNSELERNMMNSVNSVNSKSVKMNVKKSNNNRVSVLVLKKWVPKIVSKKIIKKLN